MVLHVIIAKTWQNLLFLGNGLWAYCEEHMYGRRVRDGIVEVQVYADSPIEKRSK